MPPPEQPGKILPLEALRGMAAMGVVFHHFTLAFLPGLVNFTPPTGEEGALIGSPLFLFVNGKAMVIIFFVLSGYVLSLKGLRPDAGRALADAAVKRWFRFVPVICLSLLCSYALFALGLYRYDDVFAINGARMFDHYAGFPQGYKPGFSAVLYDGVFGSLFLGQDRFNTVLWSMQIEFFGSFMVFALALLLAPARRLWFGVALSLAGILLFKEGMWFFPFLVGVLGVALHLHRRMLGKGVALAALIVALYLCGYYRPVGWYAWLAFFPLPELTLRILVTAIGGGLLLIVFATHNPVSKRFSGPISRVLGKGSFSLYLLHTLVLASFSAWAYVRAGGAVPGVLAAAAAFLITAPPLVLALAVFDGVWLRRLARWHPAGGKMQA